MILWRRPFVCYDVDLVGACAVLAIGVVTYVACVRPARVHASDSSQLTVQAAARAATLAAGEDQLRRTAEEIERLVTEIERHSSAAPGASSGETFLRQVAQQAADCGLTLAQVAPEPPKSDGPRRFSDVQIVARGRSLDFIRFLDGLRRADPHYLLLEYSLATDGEAGAAGGCRASFTIRRYFRSDPAAGPGKGGSR